MGKEQKRGFPRFCPRTAPADADDSLPSQKYVTTHRILAILLDDIEMLRDLFFKKKLAEKPKVNGGFRSVVGTAEWQKLNETTAV